MYRSIRHYFGSIYLSFQVFSQATQYKTWFSSSDLLSARDGERVHPVQGLSSRATQIHTNGIIHRREELQVGNRQAPKASGPHESYGDYPPLL